MIEIVRYNHERKEKWNQFVAEAKNGNFLFDRNYMEYHSERFTDHSLLFYRKGNLLAVMPANTSEGEFASHGGLTFGGILSNTRMKTPYMLEVFTALIRYLTQNGFSKLIYKAIPHIYHVAPAEEDLYCLFLHGAKLYRRDVSSTILMANRPDYSKARRGTIKQGHEANVTVKQSIDFETFMSIEKAHLQEKYDVEPTHTGEEMQLLASRFPENIKLYAAFLDEEMIGGVIVYESRNVAHTQYIAASNKGFELHALDVIFDTLLQGQYREKKYFDFGISTEQGGRLLNDGLIRNKESYGARATVHDFYQLDLS